jgi:hypothetical protein
MQPRRVPVPPRDLRPILSYLIMRMVGVFIDYKTSLTTH